MVTGQRKAVPLWMLKYEQARERIREITKDHPLTEVELDMLAEYAEQCVLARQADGNREHVKEYKTVVDWLESTSRISPKAHRELQAIPNDMRAKS